jgi:hypothetical protein
MNLMTYMGHSVLDEFLVTTGNEDVFVLVKVSLVSGMQPSVNDGLSRFLFLWDNGKNVRIQSGLVTCAAHVRPIKISLHHERIVDADFSDLTRSQFPTSLHVDDLIR